MSPLVVELCEGRMATIFVVLILVGLSYFVWKVEWRESYRRKYTLDKGSIIDTVRAFDQIKSIYNCRMNARRGSEVRGSKRTISSKRGV